MVPRRAAWLGFWLVWSAGIGLSATCAPNDGVQGGCQTLWTLLHCLASNDTSFSKTIDLVSSTGLSWSLDDATTSLTFFAVPDDQWPDGLDSVLQADSNLASQTALYMTLPGGYRDADLLNVSAVSDGVASALTEAYAMQDANLLYQFPLTFASVSYEYDEYIMVRTFGETNTH